MKKICSLIYPKNCTDEFNAIQTLLLNEYGNYLEVKTANYDSLSLEKVEEINFVIKKSYIIIIGYEESNTFEIFYKLGLIHAHNKTVLLLDFRKISEPIPQYVKYLYILRFSEANKDNIKELIQRIIRIIGSWLPDAKFKEIMFDVTNNLNEDIIFEKVESCPIKDKKKFIACLKKVDIKYFKENMFYYRCILLRKLLKYDEHYFELSNQLCKRGLKVMSYQQDDDKGTTTFSALMVVLSIIGAVILGFIGLGYILSWEKLITLYIPILLVLILAFATYFLITGKLQSKDFMKVVKSLLDKLPFLSNILEKIFSSKNNIKQDSKTTKQDSKTTKQDSKTTKQDSKTNA